jgi:two-component system, NarL family, invasion response regulator UvrY
MISIFLVDDHEIVREGLKKVLQREPDLRIIGEAGTGKEAVKKIRDFAVDVVILDISLPDIEGIEVLSRIIKIKPDLPVLIYTMHVEDPLAAPYLKAGAKGFLTKGDPSELLINAIRHVHTKQNFITQKVGEVLLNSWQQGEDTLPHNTLSNREFTVFRLLSSGSTITQIADQLTLAKATICTYRKRILDKMGLKTNAALMHYAVKNNLFK